MPMFAWLAFRGTLREASLLLAGVGIDRHRHDDAGSSGPVHGLAGALRPRPELVIGFLQLFLLDCALILLPLSVITTQQRIAARPGPSRQRTLERLVDAATGTAVFSIDVNGRVDLFNPGAEAIFARRSAEVVGEPADLLFTDAELGRTPPGSAAARSSPTSARPPRPRRGRAPPLAGSRRPDGEEPPLSLAVTSSSTTSASSPATSASPTTSPSARPRTRRLVSRPRPRAGRGRAAADLERVKADFVATVSHELRTPLTSMIGYVELLDDGAVGELSADQRQLDRTGSSATAGGCCCSSRTCCCSRRSRPGR